jgi:hypothetical protein
MGIMQQSTSKIYLHLLGIPLLSCCLQFSFHLMIN